MSDLSWGRDGHGPRVGRRLQGMICRALAIAAGLFAWAGAAQGQNPGQSRPASDCPAETTRSAMRFDQPRIALVIAIADYNIDGTASTDAAQSQREGYPSDLANPRNDGSGMRDALCRLGFSVTYIEDAAKAELEIGLAAFGARVAAADNPVALIYYSGHAIQVNGENWIVPAGAQLPLDVDFSRVPEHVQAGYIGAHAVSLSTVYRYLPSYGPDNRGMNLVFLDACRNNPWDARLRAGGRSLGTRGLVEQRPTASGTLVVYSTSDGQVARDGDPGGTSPFTGALLQSIAQPGIDVEVLLRRVRANVQRQTQQTGWTYGSVLTEFCFAGCTAASTATASASSAARAPAPVAASPPRPAAVAGEASLRLGREAFDREDDAQAMRQLRTAATAGNTEAMRLISILYEEGRGVPRSYESAMTWLRRAANGGNSQAMVDLGASYVRITDDGHEPAEGLAWIRRAADLGHTGAMRELSVAYQVGVGVDADEAEAIRWLARAVDAGDASAMGSIYTDVRQSRQPAVGYVMPMSWFRRWADAGNVSALIIVGEMYRGGVGVAADSQQAASWYRRAVALGDNNGIAAGLLRQLGMAP